MYQGLSDRFTIRCLMTRNPVMKARSSGLSRRLGPDLQGQNGYTARLEHNIRWKRSRIVIEAAPVTRTGRLGTGTNGRIVR
jgi:hypothetical protein